jgi:co-chaperonin GroES (HSP10)
MRYKKGKIIKPGSDVQVIKEKDLVYYDRNAGHTMLIENEQVTIIQERDVVVVL